MRFDYGDLHELLRRVNPLALRDRGVIMVFSRPADCYLHVLKYIYESFPLGFVDLWVIMVRLQGVTPARAFDVCLLRQYCLIPTWDNTEERNRLLYRIVDLLHVPIGTAIDRTQFALALSYFDIYLEKETLNNEPKITTKVKLI